MQSCRRNHQVQGKNLLERRFDDRQFGDMRTSSSMEHHSLLCHLLNSPQMDNWIGQLGQRVSSGTVGQTNVCVCSKRFHEQVRQARMSEGNAITPRIKVCTKDLASAFTQGAIETGFSRVSIRQVPVPSTRHAHYLVCGRCRNCSSK